MTFPAWFATDPWVHAVGLALLHSLWQGVAIALLVGCLLRWLHPGRSRGRHAVLLGALAAQAALVPVTAAVVRDADAGCACAEGSRAAATADGGDAGAAPRPVAAEGVAAAYRAARPVLPWLVLAWVVGVAALVTRVGLGAARVRALKRGSRPVPAALGARTRALARRVGLRRPFAVRVADGLDVPAAVGWRAPAVLIPPGVADRMDPRERDALVLHELAHLARRDDGIVLVQALLGALLFHHPAAAWLSRRLSEAREHRCDDLAASLATSLATYVRALADLESLRRDPLPAALRATGGPLAARVRRLVEPGARPPARLAAALPAAALVAVLAWAQLAVLPAVPATPPGWTTIRAVDPAGTFTVSLRRGRVVATTLEGTPLSGERFVQRGDSLHFLDARGASRFAIRVDPQGAIRWEARAADWALEGLAERSRERDRTFDG